MSTQSKEQNCFFCGGQGFVIKDRKCSFCQGTGKLNYVAWIKKRKKYDFKNEPIIILQG